MTNQPALDVEALYVALDKQRRQRHTHWKTIAAETGVPPSTFTRIGLGAGISAQALVRLLGWLGQTDLKPYLRSTP